jgi:hypothetical protein
VTVDPDSVVEADNKEVDNYHTMLEENKDNLPAKQEAAEYFLPES